jgi:hypothetical protein
MDERRRQKKLERKRGKREDKRKAADALLPLRQRLSEPEPRLTASLASQLAAPNMSDTLLTFARHELDSLRAGATAAHVERLMVLAAGVWNTVVACPEGKLEDKLWELSRALQHSSDIPLEDIFRLLRTMAERKRLLFPHDHRIVVDVAVEDEGDHFHLQAASTPGPS